VGTASEDWKADALGASLANLTDLLIQCLDAAAPRSVVEVGAYKGELTGNLLAWAEGSGATLTAIDPDPTPELLALAERSPGLELVTEVSLDALGELPLADALIIDGDHNHYTVLGELRLIAERAGSGPMPLIALHDVGWPHARRDSYHEPERIPSEHRQPIVRDVLLAPGVAGTASAGIRYPCVAAREGGPANGVLTAVEGFMAERDGLRFALIPAFFGLGILWSESAPWAGTLAEVVGPWDRSQVLERLEAMRVDYLVDRYRLDHQEALLRSFLDSRAFALSERLSRLWQRGTPAVSREKVSRVLRDSAD
jgi:hypothetical protein